MSDLADKVRELREAKAEADEATDAYRRCSLPGPHGSSEFVNAWQRAAHANDQYGRLLRKHADALLDAAEERDFVIRVMRATCPDANDSIFWRNDGGKVTFYAKCNDVFGWAASDLEQITSSNIGDFEKAMADAKAADESGDLYAGELFAARARKQLPIDQYLRALPITLRPLFDAAAGDAPNKGGPHV